jgi:hypothetical protein
MTGPVLVSSVDTTLSRFERPVLMVGERPFLYRGAQLRADTMRLNLGWSEEEIGAVVRRLKADGFTVVSIPLFWSDVELDRDRFDWDRLDRYIEWCAAADVKLEIAWFGSDSTAYSRGSGANMDRVPDYVCSEFALVTKPDGSVFSTPTHGRVLLDKTDRSLLRRESAVLARVMERVAERDAALGHKRTVIGVQLLNEPAVATVRDDAREFPAIPRSYSASSNALWEEGGYRDEAQFRRDVLLDYLSGLATAVKRSPYSVWTRCNLCRQSDAIPIRENEGRRERGEASLDLIGMDPYTHDLEYLLSFGNDPLWAQGRNLPMVMENWAGGEAIDFVVLTTLAGGAPSHHYSVIESESLTDTIGYPGIYGRDLANRKAVDTGHTLRHRLVNKLLHKAWYDFATRTPSQAGGRTLAFFNAQGRLAARDVKALGEIDIVFETHQQGAGIAILRSSAEIVLLSHGRCQFALASSLNVTGLTSGFFDEANRWITTGQRGFGTRDGRHIVELAANDCLRLTLTP